VTLIDTEKSMLTAKSTGLIFKGLRKSEAEIAAGLQTPCPDFGKCRKRSEAAREGSMPTVVPIVRHLPGSRTIGEQGNPCVFSLRKAASEML
jgi:hypothetical protein